MDRKTFNEAIVVGITKVICYVKDKNMPGGWNTAMDNMVGKPHVVAHKHGDFITLNYNGEEQHQFNYHYNNLEIFREESFVTISWQNKQLRCLSNIYLESVRGCCLVEDYIILSNILKFTNGYFKCAPENLDTIQLKCPRIIGVLLCNNLIRRV